MLGTTASLALKGFKAIECALQRLFCICIEAVGDSNVQNDNKASLLASSLFMKLMNDLIA